MTESNQTEKSVLWWSRSGRDYSRNRVIRTAFQSLGWHVEDFAARSNWLADLEARLLRVPRLDLVWVPCFRQREVAAATRWAKRHGIPVVFDPLISAWDKQVFEREKFAATSRRARQLLRWEQNLVRGCDLVIADTQCHADFFADQLGIAADRLAVIPVGAEESLFVPRTFRESTTRVSALFYGSFINLQGPDTIAEATTGAPDIDWLFIGDGPLRRRCEEITASATNVRFEPWVPYHTLPDHIAEAEIVLGVFGASDKAARVIPNKVYQALACGRPVVTRVSSAYPTHLLNDETGRYGLNWVPGGDAQSLADTVIRLSQDREQIAVQGSAASAAYHACFSNTAVNAALQQALERLSRSRQSS